VRQKDRPRARSPILHRLGDVPLQVGVCLYNLEVVAIGIIEIGGRPKAREVDHLAVTIDHRNGVKLRDPDLLRSQEEMNVMASHYPVKGGGVGHTLGRHLVGDARNDQIDRLERAVSLLCQYQAKIFELILLVEQLAFPEVQNDSGIGAKEHQDQQYRTGIKKPQLGSGEASAS
jgi:hypothetical protein